MSVLVSPVLANLESQKCERVFRIATKSLERQADLLELQIYVADLPIESLAGGKSGTPLHDALVNRVSMWRGIPGKKSRYAYTDVELREIEKIEAEMQEAYPWAYDEERLAKVYTQYGTMPFVKAFGSHVKQPDSLDGLRRLGAIQDN